MREYLELVPGGIALSFAISGIERYLFKRSISWQKALRDALSVVLLLIGAGALHMVWVHLCWK